jgi:hypothetical protein
VEQLTPKTYFKYCLIALPLVIAALLLAFWGVWDVYRADDDAQAYDMANRIDAEAEGTADKFFLILRINHDRVHWAPISNLILYPTLVDDKNTRIVLINLVVLTVVSVLAGCFSRALGADFWPAIFCSVWIASSQVLVFPVATCWGVLNMLPSVFTMSGAWVLWIWLNAQAGDDGMTKIRWRFIFGFMAFLALAMLTKETGSRGLMLAVAVVAVALVYRRNSQYRKEAAMLIIFLMGWILIYFSVRYIFTEAAVPLLRRGMLGYQRMQIGHLNNIANIAKILLASLNPVNSYAIYLKMIQRNYLLILPAVIWGITLLIGWGALIIKGGRKNRLVGIFVALLILCSLFPEFLLGKVSEMYAMASLWPLAILSAIVLTYIWTRNNWLRYVLVLSVFLIVVSNICSARVKVKEILATGRNSREIRQSMMELTKDLPNGSSVAIIYKPQPKESFARFGERGVRAGGMFYQKHRFSLKGFKFGEPIPNPEEFDLILKESEDQNRLEVVAPDRKGLQKNL